MKKNIEPKVAVLKSGYNDITDNIEKLFTLLEYAPQKNGFFIKPNLVDAAHPKKAVTTSPLIVEGIIKYIKKHHPEKEIIIGDSCALLGKFEDVIKKTGFKTLADKYNVKLVNLDDVKRREIKWKNGNIIVPDYVFTHEYINVPKMKTHCQTLASLSLKNQKGLLQKNEKQKFHSKYNLDESIKILADAVSPDLNIIDAVLSMEGYGPLLGTPKTTNLIIGSRDIYAADNAALKIMGITPKEAPHIPQVKKYQVVGEDIDKCVMPFERPKIPYVSGGVYNYLDSTMCTMCSTQVQKAFTPGFILKLVFFGLVKGRKNIIYGKSKLLPEEMNGSICFGSCSKEIAAKHKLPFVEGCPPTIKRFQEEWIKLSKKVKTSL